MIAVVVLCLSWMVGLVASTSLHGIARNSHNNNDNDTSTTSTKHNHEGSYNRLRSSSSSSLFNKNDDESGSILNDLKEIVLLLSKKIEDSDARIDALEEIVGLQKQTIENLANEVDETSSFHRHLQSQDKDCLPKFRDTPFGPRCDFSYVTRFQNQAFFNDDVVFNENVEFDSDANCMPTYNATTQMCLFNNNVTFDRGEIHFEHDVEFDDSVRFDDDVTFRDRVKMESHVEFKNSGEVTFNKATKFTENVLIQNDDHDIELKLLDRVNVRFYQDRTFKVDTDATFYQDAAHRKNVQIDGTLTVEKLTKLQDLDAYGYAWIGGVTHLDGELRANKHALVKEGLTVSTGRLNVDRDGAKIVGTTNVNGALHLDGDGVAKKSFRVEGRLTAESVLIENNNNNNRRSLQTLPVLHVRGDTNIDGLLNAYKIRSDDINYQLDLDKITDHVVSDLRDVDLQVKDLSVTNHLDKAERVLTDTRLTNLMAGTNLRVNSLTSNSATIGGRNYPHTDPSNDEITSGKVLDLLKGQNLDVESVSAGSIDTDTATIGGVDHPVSGGGNKVNIEKIVAELNAYTGEVTIAHLSSTDIEVVETIKRNIDGSFTTIPGTLLVNKLKTATSADIGVLDKRVTALESDSSGGGVSSAAEIVRALEGASLSVSSLETNSLRKSGADVPSVNEVTTMIDDGAVMTYVGGDAASECTCGAADVEAVVTSSFLQDRITTDYVRSMGFVTQDAIAGLTSGGGDCSCSASDVRANVDRSFLESLGVSFGSQDCSCSYNDITEVVDENYIEGIISELGVSTGNSDATCTCSAEDIENVVTYDYIANKGFVDEVAECSCEVGYSQISDIVTEGYISNMGFLTSCPCGNGDDDGFGDFGDDTPNIGDDDTTFEFP
eukprot:CAMPEP_0201121234 /NCGR_PEP_ID=MMETSP0850-20130426/5155_1 /ASSEMBLY_ACC=CAM_ASM_000622 /TAXON_ID=183588 /ORGANISM="Pseudo-nitzschia fraudulenta, Strain WWA7" /LENGTH=889 /DNA_ID=CAMNT_0047387627 /DNA_START=249 /DNA_END=2918 /DNA_ORIENTATION=-